MLAGKTSVRTKKPSAMQRAVVGSLMVAVACIVIGIIAYSELLFLSIVSVMFPEGVMKAAAMVGAVATGCSILVLLAGKSHWFSPGPQLLAAWIFSGVEVLILILNDILAFSLHHGAALDGYMATWYQFTPASPVIALVGWSLVIYLGNEARMRHKRMEMEQEQQEVELAYEQEAHNARMTLRYDHLSQVTGYLQDVMASPAIQEQIQNHASRLVAQVLTDVTGINALGPAQQAAQGPRVVDSQPPTRSAPRPNNPVQPVVFAQSQHAAQTPPPPPTTDTPFDEEEQEGGAEQGPNPLGQMFQGVIETIMNTFKGPEEEMTEGAPLDEASEGDQGAFRPL